MHGHASHGRRMECQLWLHPAPVLPTSQQVAVAMPVWCTGKAPLVWCMVTDSTVERQSRTSRLFSSLTMDSCTTCTRVASWARRFCARGQLGVVCHGPRDARTPLAHP